MLRYTSEKDLTWKCNLLAARLVPLDSNSPLPRPIGDIEFHQVDGARYGLRHPLEGRPGIKVQHHLMVLNDDYFVERNGVRGVALYADYNGSDICASVTSEGGRNALAPFDWDSEVARQNPLKDPAAQPKLEWREIVEPDGGVYTWQSAALHGWSGYTGLHAGKDWRDGVPEKLSTMYDPNLGTVLQSIFVPMETRGLGLSEQTLQEEDVRGTYTVALFFPQCSAESAKKLAKFRSLVDPSAYRPEPVYRGGATRGGGLESSFRGAVPKSFGGGEQVVLESCRSVEPEFKMAAGGRIRQHIIENQFGPGFWVRKPEVLLVCWPVSQETAQRLMTPNLGGRRRNF
jgi:hypothetical protein